MKISFRYTLLAIPLVAVLGLSFATRPAYRDLNKNGKMDVYEDTSKPVAERVNDILSQMTLEEKAGMMFINGVRLNERKQGGAHKAPFLYRFDQRKYEKAMKQGLKFGLQ